MRCHHVFVLGVLVFTAISSNFIVWQESASQKLKTTCVPAGWGFLKTSDFVLGKNEIHLVFAYFFGVITAIRFVFHSDHIPAVWCRFLSLTRTFFSYIWHNVNIFAVPVACSLAIVKVRVLGMDREKGVLDVTMDTDLVKVCPNFC